MTMSITTAAAFALQFPAESELVCDYADRWGAPVRVESSPENDEHLAIIMRDYPVFESASSKLSQVDALRKLAGRIRVNFLRGVTVV